MALLMALTVPVTLFALLSCAIAADIPQDVRPVLTCYRCIPTEANRFCADEFVDDNQVDCIQGRCMVMSAAFKRPSDVVRLYDCDSSNIVDRAFMLTVDKITDSLQPNTCKLIDFDNPNVISTFRDFGMNDAIAALSRGDTAQVVQAELCTCENSLCDSAQALNAMTLLPRGGPVQPLPPSPAYQCPGVAWYHIVLIVLFSLLLLISLALLGLWLYKSSKRGYRQGARDGRG